MSSFSFFICFIPPLPFSYIKPANTPVHRPYSVTLGCEKLTMHQLSTHSIIFSHLCCLGFWFVSCQTHPFLLALLRTVQPSVTLTILTQASFRPSPSSTLNTVLFPFPPKAYLFFFPSKLKSSTVEPFLLHSTVYYVETFTTQLTTL